jgi:hypothetical protein
VTKLEKMWWHFDGEGSVPLEDLRTLLAVAAAALDAAENSEAWFADRTPAGWAGLSIPDQDWDALCRALLPLQRRVK